MAHNSAARMTFTSHVLATMLAITPFASAAMIEPQVFEPGVISGGAHEAAPAFTPDGNTVYFQRSTGAGSTILVSHRRDGVWSTPKIAPFSGKWSDMEPAMSPDGTFLVFVSSRPIDGNNVQIDGFFNGKSQPGAGGNIWRVERRANGWSEPERLPDTVNDGTAVFAPAVLRDGSLLFMRPDETTKKFRLYRSQLTGAGYQPAVALPFSTGESTDVDPAADPDERFIVFGSARTPARGIDLFIVHHENGAWGTPLHMGNVINTPGSDAEPRLSPDGQRLYYSSERMTSVEFPRSRKDAEQQVEAAAVWSNGLYNIWSSDLRPWLKHVVSDDDIAGGQQ